MKIINQEININWIRLIISYKEDYSIVKRVKSLWWRIPGPLCLDILSSLIFLNWFRRKIKTRWLCVRVKHICKLRASDNMRIWWSRTKRSSCRASAKRLRCSIKVHSTKLGICLLLLQTSWAKVLGRRRRTWWRRILRATTLMMLHVSVKVRTYSII